jgi:hypothetical protein
MNGMSVAPKWTSMAESTSAIESVNHAAASTQPRVLVFNFFAGVKDRGIPIYAREVNEGLRRVGIAAIELRCPRWLARLPSPLLNVAFVFAEQIVAPLLRKLRNCSLTIYPYNSASLIDAVTGKSVLVVHDLISNQADRGQLAARYIRFTQAVHRYLRRPVCAASEQTLSYLRRLPAFSRSPLHLWPNPFYEFEAAATRLPRSRRTSGRLRVLLCTGMGPNKDYAGAIRILRRSKALAEAEVRILGFGDDALLAMRRIERLPAEYRHRITVLPRLSLEQVCCEYRDSDIVWVHSLHEGFGRSCIEARINGCRVLASNIAAFRKMRWLGLQLYKKREFDERIAELLAMTTEPLRKDLVAHLHAALERSLSDVVERYG